MQPTASTAAARAEAVRVTRRALNLNDKPSSWTYEQRQAYNKALAGYIAARPDLFTAQDATTAGRIVAKPFEPLADASFDWGMFATEATAPIVAVGEGVKTTLNLSSWLVPVAAVAAVLILLAGLAVRTGAAKPRAL